jgi:hypothetical protein
MQWLSNGNENSSYENYCMVRRWTASSMFIVISILNAIMHVVCCCFFLCRCMIFWFSWKYSQDVFLIIRNFLEVGKYSNFEKNNTETSQIFISKINKSIFDNQLVKNQQIRFSVSNKDWNCISQLYIK